MLKKKIVGVLSIGACFAMSLALGGMQTSNVNATEATVYVSSSGSDSNAGTSNAPFVTLDKALTEVVDGGTIILQDSITVNGWAPHDKQVTITGGTLNVSTLSEVEINDDVTFRNVAWQVANDACVYANGNMVTFGENVSWSKEIKLFGGGKPGTTVESTNLTVLSGTYTHIYGGGNSDSNGDATVDALATVTGDTNLIVGGCVNNTSAVDSAIVNHADKYYIFGGGFKDFVGGSTNVTMLDTAKAVYVYGGSNGWSSKIVKGANLTIENGTYMGIFGGTKGADSGSGAKTYIKGGSMQQVFGGNESFTMTGNVDLRIVGGTITRRIYAGCYGGGSNEWWVTGKVNLELGGDVNITLDASHSDKGIYARSRYEGDVENSQIVFTSAAAYNAYKNKLGGSDWGASYIMGDTNATDECHYYNYTQNDNMITQTCAYHTDLSATATWNGGNDASQYTGEEIEPFAIVYSNNWEYSKATIAYQNNIEIGEASYSLSFGETTIDGSFLIIDIPTVLGGSVRLSAPSGLRFQSKVASEMLDVGATFGTLVIPKSELGENELTMDTPMVQNIVQTMWATDSVKENNPQAYEEGYEYFNAVLTDIPEEHYDKVIVARSYVCIDGQYYYADMVERSIAQVSAYAIQDGYTEEILYQYIDKALADSTVSIESSVELYEGSTYQLNLSGHKGYAAIWSSSDESIATVDNNGKITALKKEGTVVITARIGNISVACTLTVNHKWTGYY